ncbi:hypothetical protein QTQ03_08820 [Micromonospora sp. WMMA1363]|uniref:hypothetical protein n=1 Tax=Micromonospora sp. WMMA1363 TaxID=3053985 RepID=UPI00259D289E|nr:hypothetical protein [Micromonospora sp. WMMA1363]MDM4719675.1 hypothetical protein [Micromonospora sp. WMMA1363]
MTKPTDPLTTLTALRPRTSIEHLWPSASRDASLAAITATDPAAAATAPRRRPRRTRRLVLAAVLSVLAIPAGLGVASATGIVPEAFRDLWMLEQDTGVDLANISRVATAPGPEGSVFAVWMATNPDNDYICLVPIFEKPDGVTKPEPSVLQDGAAGCHQHDPKMKLGENMWVGSSQDETGRLDLAVYAVSAGRTTRAELRMPDGSTLPALRVKDRYVGWFPYSPNAPKPILTAYNASGDVAAQVNVPD